MKARSSEIDLNKIDQPYTKLNKRVLFFDGDYVVLPDQVEEFLHYGDLDHLKVIEINEEVEKFNTLSDQQIKTKDSLNKISLEFNIEGITITEAGIISRKKANFTRLLIFSLFLIILAKIGSKIFAKSNENCERASRRRKDCA